MPSFLKDLSLRRRSKASVRTSETRNSSGNSSSVEGPDEAQSAPASNGNKSTSTLSSFFDKTSPPTTLSSAKSRSSSHLPSLARSNGDKTPPLPNGRPRMPSSQSNRYSLVVSEDLSDIRHLRVAANTTFPGNTEPEWRIHCPNKSCDLPTCASGSLCL